MQKKTYDSKVAKLYIVTQNSKIIAISFSALDEDYLNKLLKHPAKEIKGGPAEDLAKQLDSYFLGKNPKFNLQLQLHGTDFQKAVWMACASIPYGETRSYGDLAKMIGKPKAVRAVGTALSQNPIPLIIPCHRVLRSDGNLGGFAGGLVVKKALLDLEKM
ncbi:MAG: methylated-DNA--[protein]-cysteine S-methyltransferase [Candidatus Marinimicrobia bacterium]|nr:methylated-DNA--[protein]-cysteine S-methyltransferase [Candidatus Neomarinimicrobiota bacterium]